MVKYRPFPRVEERRIFKDPDSGFDRVQARPAGLKDLVSGNDVLFEFSSIFLFLFRRQTAFLYHARSAVDDKPEPRILRALKLLYFGKRAPLREAVKRQKKDEREQR